MRNSELSEPASTSQQLLSVGSKKKQLMRDFPDAGTLIASVHKNTSTLSEDETQDLSGFLNAHERSFPRDAVRIKQKVPILIVDNVWREHRRFPLALRRELKTRR